MTLLSIKIQHFFWKLIISVEKLFFVFKWKSKEDNVTAVISKLIKVYNIRSSGKYSSEFLKSNNDYPSLKCVCDFFKELNINYTAIKIGASDLFMIKNPFLAHLNINMGMLYLIYYIDQEYVVISDGRSARKIIETKSFLEKWEGVIILLNPDSGEVSAESKLKWSDKILNRILLLLSIISIVVLITVFIQGYIYSPKPLIILLNNFLGLGFSIFLVLNDLNLTSSFTETICHISSNLDCNEVTKSKASQIFADLTWADIGISWFTGRVIFFTATNGRIDPLFYTSLLSLCFPAFSVFYQTFKIHKFCPFCIAVQLTIIADFILLLNSVNTLKVEFSDLAVLFSISLISLIVEILIKRNYKLNIELLQTRISLLKIKRDPEIFTSLNSQSKVFPDLGRIIPIQLGKTDSTIKVTVFLSLYCSSCSKCFGEIVELIQKPANVNFELVIYPGNDMLTRKMFQIINSFQSSSQKDKIIEVLSKWYRLNLLKRQNMVKEYELIVSQSVDDQLIENCKYLFDNLSITKVPSIFINNCALNKVFGIEDLKYQFVDKK